MPTALTEEDVAVLCERFQLLDSNKDGFVDAGEVEAMVYATFPGVPAETAQAACRVIMEEGDRDGNGRIDIGEFLAFIEQKQSAARSAAAAPASGDADAASASAAGGTGFVPPSGGDGEDPTVTAIMRQLSPEDIDMYRDTFIRLDRNGDGFVDRNELMQCVREFVGEVRFAPLAEYLDRIFDVADKDRDDMLSLTEFLSSFANGPGVVPQDVVTDCVASIRVRLSDDEICTLQDSFRQIDKNGDGFVDAAELHVALKDLLLPKCPDLTEQAFSDIVGMVLATADRDQDGMLNLAEFIRSYQEDQGVLPTAFIDGRSQRAARKLTQQEVAVLKEAFNTLDANHDGYVDYSELYSSLSSTLSKSGLDKDQVRDLVDLILITAGRNGEGKLTLTDFIRNFVQHEELMAVPVKSAVVQAEEAARRLQELLDSGEVSRMVKVFDYLDSNHDGFLDQAELHGVLRPLLAERFPDWSAETAESVVSAIIAGADVDRDGKISLAEFVQSFVSGSGVLPPDVVHEWGALLRRQLSSDELRVVQKTFVSMDQDHDGFVSREELKRALGEALKEVLEDEAHLQRVTDFVMEKVDEDQDGKVSLKEFLASFEKDEGVLPVVDAVAADGTSSNEATVAGGAENATIADPPGVMSPIAARPVSPVGKQLAQGSGTGTPLPNTSEQTQAPAGTAAPLPELATTPQLASTGASPALTGPAIPRPQAVAVVEAEAAPYLTPERQRAAQLGSFYAASPIINDVSGVAISDAQLRQEFKKYDTQGQGWIGRAVFKKAYLNLENFGLEPSPADVDRLFSKFCAHPDRVSYEEFCLLMLRRSRM